MRTKTLLAAAAIVAAGLASSQAQSNVYSLNVVGYVNSSYVPGFNLTANPLVNSTNNLNNIIKLAPDNTLAFIYDPIIQDFDANIPTFVAGPNVWSPSATINPGVGFFLFTDTAFTNTYVGEVKQGTTTLAIQSAFNGVSSPAPIGGSLSNVLQSFPVNDNDLALQYDPIAQDFLNIATFVSGPNVWSPDLNVKVGEGLFYFSNTGSTTNWVRNFTVQ